jgi:hypothetical protein
LAVTNAKPQRALTQWGFYQSNYRGVEMNRDSLTQERLKYLIEYNPETGIFVWRQKRSPKTLPGDIAGSRSNGYVVIIVDGYKYPAHRLAWLYMTGSWPAIWIDHKDTVRHNNKWDNLREATPAQNRHNSVVSTRNKSGVKGVSFCARNQFWIAQCCKDGKNIRIGSYKKLEDAAAAHAAFAKQYHGEFYKA